MLKTMRLVCMFAVAAASVAFIVCSRNFTSASAPTPQGTRLACTSIVQTISRPTSVNCAPGYTLVSASCNAGASLVTQDKASPILGPGRAWADYLIPSKDTAIGVFCGSILVGQNQAHLRCCRMQ
jgi:hypothetical protein